MPESPIAEVPPAELWSLDPGSIYLNHGSFGCCPRPVLAFQNRLRAEMEGQPMRFLVRELEARLDEARASVARFVGAQADELVFLSNTTEAVNTVFRSLAFEPGDEILTTDHTYAACHNALVFAADRRKARVVRARIPFPIDHPDEVVDRILGAVTDRTRMALIDHVTSPTALVFPIEKIVRALEEKGIDTFVDGAHAPGMVPVDLEALGAAYYAANGHKWLCGPKTSAILRVRSDKQAKIRPLTISHGASSRRTDRSRFQLEFGWTGTRDPTAFLALPEAIRIIENQTPEGWEGVRDQNRALALAARDHLCSALGIPAPCPEEMVGSMAAIPLPKATEVRLSRSPLYEDPLQKTLLEHGIEVPIAPWPAPLGRVLRVSAQRYNAIGDFEELARILRLCGPDLAPL